MNNESLINDYSKMIYSIAKKYSYGNDIDDLYQVGVIGLLKAFENFDFSFNNKFSTYAHTYILGEILKFVRENKTLRLSKEVISLSRSINKAKEVLDQKLGRSASVVELADFLQINVDELNEALIKSEYAKVASLDYDFGQDDDGNINLYNAVAYHEKGYNEEFLDLYDALDDLTDEDKKIILYRYFNDNTQQEISNKLGMSQVQVSRKESKILTKLKDKLAC